MKTVVQVGKPWEQNVEFSLGVLAEGRFLFTAGITARNPDGKVAYVGDMRGQIQQCFDNLKDVLKSAGADWMDVVKFTLYTTDIKTFVAHRDLWGRYFEDNPASTLIGVKDLIDPDMMVEIEAIVHIATPES